MDKVVKILTSPLAWMQERVDVGSSSLAWVATLPQSHQLLLGHARNLFEGRHNEQLKGYLASPGPAGALPEAFLKLESMQKLFLEPFEKAWKQTEEGVAEKPLVESTSTVPKKVEQDRIQPDPTQLNTT